MEKEGKERKKGGKERENVKIELYLRPYPDQHGFKNIRKKSEEKREGKKSSIT